MWPFCSNWAEVDFSEEITNSRINNNWERVYDEDSEEEIIEFDYENLPIEIIIMIFEYLNPSDRDAAALVCLQWFYAAQYYRFRDVLTLHLNDLTLAEHLPPTTLFLDSATTYSHMNLSKVKFGGTNEFWLKFGPYIQTLTISSGSLPKNKFLSIIKYSPRLQRLSLENCNELFKNWKTPAKGKENASTVMKHLKCLSLANNPHLSEEVFNSLMALAPRLEELELSQLFLAMNAAQRRSNLLNILQYVTKNAGRIRSLNFNGTPLEDSLLFQISEIQNLRLDSLSMTFSGKESNPGIINLIYYQKYITYLDLSYSLSLTDFCLTKICATMKGLRTLILKKCWMLTDYGIQELEKLPNLEKIDISNCERITDAGIIKGVVSNVLKPNMRSLNVSLLANMSEQAILHVSAAFSGLLELDLAGSSNSVTDYSIQLIFSNMIRLRSLNLDCCGKVTDDGIVGNINSSDVYYPNSILFLSGLRYLNLTRCYKISDVTLKRGLRLIELKEISLARCQLITEEGIESLARNCPSLEIIDLTECQNVTDEAVDSLTRHLKRLKSLKLNHCSQLTDASLDAILKNCEVLKYLYVRGCFRMTEDPAQYLSELSSLRNISAACYQNNISRFYRESRSNI